MLKDRGEHDQAKADLPDHVDTDQHCEELTMLGVDPKDLIGGAGGGIGEAWSLTANPRPRTRPDPLRPSNP